MAKSIVPLNLFIDRRVAMFSAVKNFTLAESMFGDDEVH